MVKKLQTNLLKSTNSETKLMEHIDEPEERRKVSCIEQALQQLLSDLTETRAEAL